MNTQRIDPPEVIPIVPPRIAEAESMLSLDQLRARFARDEGLPFADVLTEPRIREALDEHGVRYRDRVFDPVTTLWGFLSQVLGDDHSCRDAVARIIAHRAANGLETCSPNTASYCNARSRLPTGVLRTLGRQTAAELQAAAAEDWNGLLPVFWSTPNGSFLNDCQHIQRLIWTTSLYHSPYRIPR
jgi:hypothetical protein